ncbi:FAD-binding oxidoreductase [Aquincola sp. MAHUQ-54]|uniref:FAD-binding oxidoreductase n=1 Tax=Aquincola agrisoli TaxID=3119538 RepID=A0AAW9QEA3_9BURK
MTTVVLANGNSFASTPGQSLLDAALAAGLVLEHSCKTGRCSSCKARVTAGSTEALRPEEGLCDADQRDGWILTCVRSATTDVTLDIEDLGEVADYPARTWPARIQQLERVADDVMRITLRLPPTANFRYLAGQYIDVIGPDGLRRAYSVANAPAGTAGPVELHVRAVEGGRMSDYWFNRAKQNDLLRIHGPLGTFFLREAADDDIVFLATGTGIAPVKAMLEQLGKSRAASTPRQRVTVYWGNRVPSDHYWQPASEGLDVTFVPIASRAAGDWQGARGHAQDVFLTTKPDLSRTWVYACGSNAMIEAAQRQLVAAGLPAKRFHSDAFVCSS